MKAYDLLPLLGEPSRPVKPQTAYRALEFWEELGLVHRIASLNVFVACSVGGSDHIPAFLICECCGVVEEFDGRRAPSAAAVAAAHQFEIGSISLEARGRCAACKR